MVQNLGFFDVVKLMNGKIHIFCFSETNLKIKYRKNKKFIPEYQTAKQQLMIK